MANNNKTKASDFRTNVPLTWCPGCGNFVLYTSLINALVDLGVEPHKTVICFDIGCISNGADNFNVYGFKSLHGRAIPPAVGIKLARPDLTVVAVLGDGGAYGEGIEHLISSARRDDDVTVIVANNQLYALTTGQASPTTPKGRKLISHPDGTLDQPLDPIAMAKCAGAKFAKQGNTDKPEELKQLITDAILHKGFALVDIMQKCVTWNKE